MKKSSSFFLRNFNKRLRSQLPTSMKTFDNQPFSHHFSSRQRLQKQAPKAELLEAWLALTIGLEVLKPIGCHGI